MLFKVKNMNNSTGGNKPKKKTVFNTFRRDYQLWLMIFPALVVIIIFNYIPMYGVQLAFKDFDFQKGLTGGDFRGLFYFKQFVHNYMFLDLLRNTISISLANIVFGFPMPIILAILINQIKNAKFKKIIQTTVYLPHFISIVVIVGMLRVLLSPNDGVVGYFLSLIGYNTNLLGTVKTFIPVYVLSEIWQHNGWNCIIYLAALSSVSPELYDSCKIDGASRLQTIFFIDLPTIRPTIIILFVLSMGNVLNTGFEKIFLMQNSLNLPISEVITTYVYKIGIISNQFSYASAINLFNTIINFALLFSMNKISKKFADISLW